jgi:hypothetical protein
MPTPGQLNFDGRPVEAFKLKIGDLELDYFPEGLDADDLASLSLHDEIEVTLRFKVEDIGHGEKVDRLGVGTKPLTRTIVFKTLRSGLQVTGILKKADVEEAWRRDHGATG